MTNRAKMLACLGLAVVGMVMMLLPLLLFAQEATIAPVAEPSWKPLLDMAIKSLIPALWMAVGPIAVAGITKAVNSLTTAYVPRPLQVVLSAIVAAVGAGLSGDPSVAITGAVSGGIGQVLAATNPATLRTEGPQS